MLRTNLLKIAMTSAMVISLLPSAAFATTEAVTMTFKDVPAGSWYFGDVEYAYKEGLVNGRSADTFAPDESLTCAEAVKLAACMDQKYDKGSVSFETEKPWYTPYVEYAEFRKIIDRDYDWNSPITRAEYAEIFSKALPDTEFEARNTIEADSIPDIVTAHPQAEAIYKLYRAGILVGNDANGSFCPDRSIKRSEVSAVLTRMMNKDARRDLHLDKKAGTDSDLSVAKLQIDAMAERSNLVALAELKNVSDPFDIKPVFGGEPQSYVDCQFTVKDVLKGTAETDETITVRIRSDQKIFTEKKSDLYLCLYKPDMGSGYNTAGDYYYLTGGDQGTFDRHGDAVTNSAGIRLMEREFREIMMAHASTDAPFSLRAEFLNNLQQNLESGFITDQEEYERLLREIDQYAEIVKR